MIEAATYLSTPAPMAGNNTTASSSSSLDNGNGNKKSKKGSAKEGSQRQPKRGKKQADPNILKMGKNFYFVENRTCPRLWPDYKNIHFKMSSQPCRTNTALTIAIVICIISPVNQR